jgi:hypothetical protein
MAWKPLHLSASAAAHLPPFLLSAAFESRSYTIHLTDLTNIWSESLDREAIIRRSQEENTSIDPTDNDQFRILLEKIRLGLGGGNDTTSAMTINVDDDRPTVTLNLTVNLPGGLAPLQWPIRFVPGSQSLFTNHLTIPLLGAQQVQMQEVKALGEVIEVKDHVIQKLLDRLESRGTELGDVFPQAAGKAGRKIDRKSAEGRVKGLARFDIDSWRQGLETEKSHDAGRLISELFASDKADGLKIEAGVTQDEAAESWWESIKGITVNLNTGRITTNGLAKSTPRKVKPIPKPSLPKEPSIDEDDDFQTQATPPQLASRTHKPSPSKPALDDTTDDDDDLGGPSQVSRVPDSFPKSQSQSHVPRSPSSPARPKKLGKIGAKKSAAAAAPEPSPPPVEEDTATESPPPSPLQEKPRSPTPEPLPKPKPKGKLGKIGGKKAAPPPEPEPERASTLLAAPATPKTKGKLGKIGGKKKASTSTPDPNSPEAKVKSSPHSTPERGRSVKVEKEKTPEPELEERETSLDRADRKRAQLKRELEEKARAPVKKRRKF